MFHKKDLIKAIKDIPIEGLRTAYAVDLFDSYHGLEVRVQGYWNDEFIDKHKKLAVQRDNGFLGINLNGITFVFGNREEDAL